MTPLEIVDRNDKQKQCASRAPKSVFADSLLRKWKNEVDCVRTQYTFCFRQAKFRIAISLSRSLCSPFRTSSKGIPSL